VSHPPVKEGRVAFVRHGDVFVMNADGSHVVHVGRGYDPSWSPDGTRLAFRAGEPNSRSRVTEIDVIDPSGGGLVRHSVRQGSPSTAGRPTWSADGRTIAFATYDGIDAVRAGGGNRVSRISQYRGSRACYDLQPAWSPDGTKIAFAVECEGKALGLWIESPDGSHRHQLLAVPHTMGWYRYPVWSPDNGKIVFEADARGGAPTYVMVTKADGTHVRRLAIEGQSGEMSARPVWSPDGSHILFARTDGLYVMNADGSGLVQLTHRAGDEEPAWGSVRTPLPRAVNDVIDMSFGNRSVWALTCDQGCTGDRRHSTGRALRIDPASGRIVASVALNNPSRIAVGEGYVWVISFWNGTLTRIDPATAQVAATIRLRLPFAVCKSCPGARDFLPFDVAVGEGAVWVDTGRGVLVRIDPATNRVAAEIRLPGDSTGDLSVGEGAVWVTENVLGLYRIDPATNRVTARVTTDDKRRRRLSVGQVTVGGGAVFVQGVWARKTTSFGHVEYVSASGAAIARIDPASNRSVAIFPVGKEPRFMGFDRGALWRWRDRGTRLERVDPETGRVTATVDAPAGGYFVGVGGGYGWVLKPHGTIPGVSLPTA
jgi:TolB protein